MIFKGIKIKVSCLDWEQVETLGGFWNTVSSKVNINKLAGLGFGWENNHFNYAIGLIDNFEELNEIKAIKENNSEYIEIELPDMGWKTKKGKTSEIQEIYEREFDCYNVRFKYEIEKFDEKDNCEISVFI